MEIVQGWSFPVAQWALPACLHPGKLWLQYERENYSLTNGNMISKVNAVIAPRKHSVMTWPLGKDAPAAWSFAVVDDWDDDELVAIMESSILAPRSTSSGIRRRRVDSSTRCNSGSLTIECRRMLVQIFERSGCRSRYMDWCSWLEKISEGTGQNGFHLTTWVQTVHTTITFPLKQNIKFVTRLSA